MLVESVNMKERRFDLLMIEVTFISKGFLEPHIISIHVTAKFVFTESGLQSLPFYSYSF